MTPQDISDISNIVNHKTQSNRNRDLEETRMYYRMAGEISDAVCLLRKMKRKRFHENLMQNLEQHYYPFMQPKVLYECYNKAFRDVGGTENPELKYRNIGD